MKYLITVAGAAAFAMTGCGSATGGSTGSAQPQQPATASGQPQTQSEPATPTVDLAISNDTATVYSDRYVLRGTVTRGAKVLVEGDRAKVRGHRWSFAVRLRGTGDQPFTVTANKRGWESAETDATLTRKLSAAERAARAAARQRARERAAAERAARKAARQRAASRERALETAQNYLEMSGFSRNGLIEQLSSSAGEGFPMADAIWAVDHVQVDWNQEAVESAKNYLEMSPMSKSALIDQLSSSAGEGFTLAQAQYAADKAY